MQDAKHIAEQATMQSFLNCYLRETGSGDWLVDREEIEKCLSHVSITSFADMYLRCRLPLQNITLYTAVKYMSPTGRHIFGEHSYYEVGNASFVKADYLTIITLLVKEMSLQHGENTNGDELVLRVIQSCHNIKEFIEKRAEDKELLYGVDTDFIDAEQALLFGHLTHPTPKSRQGIVSWKNSTYSPELKGKFQLHYFRAHKSIVKEDSAFLQTSTEIMKDELKTDSSIPAQFIESFCQEDEYSLIPIHPLQAEWLLHQPHVKKWIDEEVLQYLGAVGKEYMATSSLRTLYHPDSNYMLKFSFPVKVTNSLRVNKLKELDSGVEGKKLLETGIGRVREEFPGFDFICDPAYMTLSLHNDMESGFEVIIRENVFRGEHAKNATLIAALVQDALPGEKMRLANIIEELAKKEARSVREVSLDWFRRYLDISLKPMVWLHVTYGIALEAHQQNSVVTLQDGYPAKFYFRDNQGFYFCKSMKDVLDAELPGIGEESDNLYDDRIADERFRYYLIFNHMFGLINGFGVAELIDERILLGELRKALEGFVPYDREHSQFLDGLLKEDKLACKANLLTRFYDVDELISPLEQAIYVKIDNPLVTEFVHSREEAIVR